MPKKPDAGRSPSIRSESTEDHLERIQELVEAKGYARVTDIAEALALNRSTVSNMVRRLAKRGYVNYERYRGFTLTAEGQAFARQVKQRHRTLSELLELMGVAPEAVADDVEDIEHHLRPQTLRVFESLVEFWRQTPVAQKQFLEFHRRREHTGRVGRVGGRQ